MVHIHRVGAERCRSDLNEQNVKTIQPRNEKAFGQQPAKAANGFLLKKRAKKEKKREEKRQEEGTERKRGRGGGGRNAGFCWVFIERKGNCLCRNCKK